MVGGSSSPHLYDSSVSLIVIASALIIGFNLQDTSQFHDVYATITNDDTPLGSSNASNSATSLNYSLVGSTVANSTQEDTDLGNSGASIANFSSPIGPQPGTLQIPYTGITRYHIGPESAKLFGLKENTYAILVTEVEPRSPAEVAGIRGGNMTTNVRGDIIKHGGDIILRIDGNDTYIRTNEVFLNYLQNEKSPGQNMTMAVLRNGQINDVNLTIGALPRFLWYDDFDEGIRIKYPSDWEISETESIDEIVRFFTPHGVRIDNETQPAAGIFVLISDAGDSGLDDFAERERRDTNVKRNLDLTLTSISNLPAYETLYYDFSENRTLKKLSAFTINEGKLYTIEYATDPNRYDEYVPLAREVINSFQFTR